MFNICIVKPKIYIHYQAFTEVAEHDQNTKINNDYLSGIKATSYNELIENVILLLKDDKASEELGDKSLTQIRKYSQEQFTKKILNL